MIRLTLLKKENCHACRVIYQELAFLGLSSSVEKKDVENELNAKRLLLAGGQRSVPCLLIEKNGSEGACEKEWIYGVEEITQYLRVL